jgi:hypothetical protein
MNTNGHDAQLRMRSGKLYIPERGVLATVSDRRVDTLREKLLNGVCSIWDENEYNYNTPGSSSNYVNGLVWKAI